MSAGSSSVVFGFDDDDAAHGGATGGGGAGEQDRVTLTAKPHAFAGAVLCPKHARELTPSLCVAVASALAEQSHHKPTVPYTLWITEAWRILGIGEPSAALFWELATMFHTLFLAAKAFAAEFDGSSQIPPILSCGSTSSLGSGMTNDNNNRGGHHGTGADSSSYYLQRKKFSAAASAKELPVWLISTFLLLHCEEFAYQRNLSGKDERRFFGEHGLSGAHAASVSPSNGRMDFFSLFKNTSLSPRTRLHAGWNLDNTHCTAYLLRHLRKVLLLTAVPHNPEAVRACMHLAAIPSPPPGLPTQARHKAAKYSADELRRQHDDEHGNVGASVQLTMEDLERLHLVLQPPQGGGIDDPPLKIGEFIFQSLYRTVPPPTASLPIGEVEREIRRHLELEMLMAGVDPDDKESDDDEQVSSAESALAKLSLGDRPSSGGGKSPPGGSHASAAAADAERAKQPHLQYQKELSYTHLRGTTILLKPNPTETISSGASSASGGDPNPLASSASGRLHDLAISDCSDAHFYLLQPFEHATISACTGCTIVVGAVAGLLHVVDCEKTAITTASRRILVSNSCDVQLFVFTPSPPLLVGDNRSCQFAPYNTYYDGLREDLLATGLAAAVLPENQSPYHGGRTAQESAFDGAWPPLQCASNKWKQPIELAKLEVPQVAALGPTSSAAAASPAGPNLALSAAGVVGADDARTNDATMLSPILMPASDFHILFVPVESDAARQRRLEVEESDENTAAGPMESQYCVLLAEILQLSPFRLPVEFERRVLVKADRMRHIQQAVKKNLNEEHQKRFEEELNRGFREWLVQSGNLRQVLDLVHLERRGGA